MMNGLKKLCKNLPKSVEGMKPMLIYPILGLLFIALIMYFIVNPIFSTINVWITNFLNHLGTGNAVLLSLILAGMMSTWAVPSTRPHTSLHPVPSQTIRIQRPQQA